MPLHAIITLRTSIEITGASTVSPLTKSPEGVHDMYFLSHCVSSIP